VEVLAGNSHFATQKLIAFCPDPNSDVPSAIVTEFHPNGDLRTAVEKEWKGDGALDATVKSKIIFGIVATMAHLHSRGILHRDLRPSKILLNDRWEPVLGMSTLSRHFDGGLNLTMAVGTPMFMAPELWNSDGYDFSVDVYAFSVTLYSIFAEPTELDDGKGRARSSRHFQMRILRGVRFLRKPEIPGYHWGVITRCWVQDPKSRPTFKILLDEFRKSHEYILPEADRSAVLRYERLVYSQ
jgi:serine/threonine protein kinase